ncbi:unnamed protein product [Phytomonas sp. EM1]|nr:unnamed protein product [Phytomonas sp. EM1]|eukprot:CCW64990.1 unnamed protein product [Phytomonas sp. isolate EM1]
MSHAEASYIPTAGILIETSLGSLVFDLYGCDCPGLTANYANLCRCHFWNGAVATEVIPGAAIFFSHAADPVYDALLGGIVTSSSGGGCGSFWALLQRSPEEGWRLDAARQLRSPGWDSTRERELAKARSCMGITPFASPDGKGRKGVSPVVFQPANGRRAVGSLSRRGLLIVSTPTSSSGGGGGLSSEAFRFGITLSDRPLDFLEDQYVAIGEVGEGWNVLDRLRRAPHAEAGPSRWPRPLRMLRIKHTTVLPTAGVDGFLTAPSSTLEEGASPQKLQQLQTLRRGLQVAGCFAFWAPPGAIAAAARVLAQQAAMTATRYPPPSLPSTATSEEEVMDALEGEKARAQPLVLPPRVEEEIPSPEYNAHYTGDYLSSGEEDLPSTAASAAEQRQRRQAILEMHREHANTTLALMMNLLNGVADVEGELKPPENVLFVCKLNPITTGEGLAMCFAQFGKVLSAEVVMDKSSKRSLCYGFVEFDTVDACYRAFQKMDRALIDDSRIHVDFSQSVSKLWFQKQREMRKRARGT